MNQSADDCLYLGYTTEAGAKGFVRADRVIRVERDGEVTAVHLLGGSCFPIVETPDQFVCRIVTGHSQTQKFKIPEAQKFEIPESWSKPKE